MASSAGRFWHGPKIRGRGAICSRARLVSQSPATGLVPHSLVAGHATSNSFLKTFDDISDATLISHLVVVSLVSVFPFLRRFAHLLSLRSVVLSPKFAYHDGLIPEVVPARVQAQTLFPQPVHSYLHCRSSCHLALQHVSRPVTRHRKRTTGPGSCESPSSCAREH